MVALSYLNGLLTPPYQSQLVRVPIFVLSPRGVSLWQVVEACSEDGVHRHLPDKPALRFPE
jgi:hypothetical protein